MKKRYFVFILAILLSSFVGYRVGVSKERASLRTMFSIFARVLNEVQRYYVEEKDPVELVEKSIEGMVNSLDPFSEFLTPEESEEWSIATTGEFGGIGIQIGIRDNWLTVIAPIDGTPAYRAGLKAGDRIIEIEGETTKGMKIRDAVKRLRGNPGTKVTIKIQRPGLDKPFEVTLIRAIIHIKSVPFYTLLEDNIGYIRLSTFQTDAEAEVRAALDSLANMGAEKFILDLRGNPGGLLSEAVRISGLFLGQGKLVVSTRSRIVEMNMEYYTQKDSPYKNNPLVILVDRGSASASEIVSGAIQDWDRGVIVGDTTFGKGSVQRIFKLDEGYELKLTTAKYYTPSGRCIHKEQKEETDSVGVTQKIVEKVYTKILHREVYGGGGIAPDIHAKSPQTPEIVARLYPYFFTFAVEYHATHPQYAGINEKIIQEFASFLKRKEIKFSMEDFNKAYDFIKLYLDAELQEKYYGMEARYKTVLDQDKVMRKAIEIMKNLDDIKTTRKFLEGLK